MDQFASQPDASFAANRWPIGLRKLAVWFGPGLESQHRLRLLVVGAAYFLAHQLAFFFPHSAGMLVAVWPAGGIGLAMLLLSRRALWPTLLGVLFGAGVLANLCSGRPVFPSVGFMVANVAESGLSAWLITRLCGSQITFRRVNEVVALIAAAIVINADTAFIGAGTAALSTDKPFWDFYKNWWIADALGLLLITPLIFFWGQKPAQPATMTSRRKLELALLALLAGLGVWLVFGVNHAGLSLVPHPYMLSLVMIWAALRFEPRATATLLAFVGVLAIGYTDLGQGSFPLGGNTRSECLLMVQVYIGILSVVCLLLSTSQTERRASEDLLRRSEGRLRTIGDNLPNSMIYQALREADGTLRFLHVSAAIERLNGLSPEAVRHDAALFYNQIVPEDKPVVAAAAAESLRTMGVFNVTIRMRRTDGELRWMQLCAAPRWHANGGMLWDGVETDVTELKLTKQALTASEALLHQFIKYAPAAVAMLDNEMCYVQASDRWLADYHLDGQDIIGKSHYEVFPDIPERWKEVHRRVLGGATESCEQDPFPRADGTMEWLHWEVRPWFKPDGQIGGLIMFTQVITERRRVEDALRLSENRFRSAMQNSPIGMGLVTLDRNWLEVNPALCRIVGYATAELVGHGFDAITHPEDRAGEPDFIAELLERKMENYQSEQRYQHKDGKVVWGQLNVSLVRDPDGTPRHFVFQIQNITERKRTMFELIGANARYAQHEAALTTLTRSYVAEPGNLNEVLRKICEAAAKALEVGRVSIWRYNAARNAINCDVLFEAARNQFSSGMELSAAIIPSYFRALTDADVIVAHDVEHDLRTREMLNAYLRPVGITSMLDVPIHSQGKAVGVLCCEHVGEKRQWKPDEQTFAIAVANLVSMQLAHVERQELEEQFRQAQKLDALGTLAGGIAHDFNNILAAIISFAELAKMDNPANDELQENLSQILKASNRAASLVRQILWFSRHQKQTRRPLQLEPVVKEALGLIRATLPATIEIAPRLTSPVPDVLADASQIHQVVMNLCANAGHAMQGRSGRLQVELNPLRVDHSGTSPNLGLREGLYVSLAITDTGHGMDEATRKRIFEPFFTTKAPGEGTGLGLSVVHGIVKGHDGVITVQSTPGQGSTFTILLPAAQATVLTDQRECGLVPKGRGQRILFVDDEPDLCEAASRMINRLGYVPVIFGSSEEAWRAIQQQPDGYDLMVSDLTMPVMTGTDLARNVLRLRPTFPIVITSGYTGGMSEGFIRELGIRELVPKPLDYQSLAQAINRALTDPPSQQQ